MPCGCKGRMAKLEQKAPKLAKAVRPAHEVAMRALDAVDRRIKRAGYRRAVTVPPPEN